MRTATMKLADLLLGQPVDDWIRDRRPHTPWRHIAVELRDKTNGQIDVTPQSLINWTTDGERVAS